VVTCRIKIISDPSSRHRSTVLKLFFIDNYIVRSAIWSYGMLNW